VWRKRTRIKTVKLFGLGIFTLCSLHTISAQFAVTSKKNDTEILRINPNQSINVKKSYDVVSIAINAVIKNQMANVVVTQEIKNTSNNDMEVELFFPLPNDGIIQNFILLVDGKEIVGKILEKEEAK